MPHIEKIITMKKTVIVTTDFSDSADNAINYACKFARDYDLNILLVHIYTIPGSYAAEGLSLATINDEMEEDRARLKSTLTRVKRAYVNIAFETRMIAGELVASLQQLKKEVNAALIIMGADVEYPGIWQLGDDWLNALTEVACPVLVIPPNIAYSPIMRIAFASDKTGISIPAQTDAIKKLVNLSNSEFYIVHVTPKINPETEAAEDDAYHEVFRDIDAQYHIIEHKSIVKGLAEFIEQYFIDILIVVPHKHGFWHRLMNKSYTKQLALLNHIPVMAIHENE